MNQYHLNQLDRIERDYNPEYDVPDGPPVPWYTARLVAAVQELAGEVATLRRELDQLKADHAALDEVVDGTFERMEAVGR